MWIYIESARIMRGVYIYDGSYITTNIRLGTAAPMWRHNVGLIYEGAKGNVLCSQEMPLYTQSLYV